MPDPKSRRPKRKKIKPKPKPKPKRRAGRKPDPDAPRKRRRRIQYYRKPKKRRLTPDIAAWIDAHPAVADAIKWQTTFQTSAYSVPEAARSPWSAWPPWRRQALVDAFKEAWSWYHRKRKPLDNLQEAIVYPPVNLSETLADDNLSPMVVVDEAWAWEIYRRWVALHLVVELANLVPWSVLGYDATKLQVLFDSAARMSRRPGGDYVVGAANPEHPNFILRKDNRGGSLLAPPRYTYAFLAKNRLVGATTLATIGNLLQWARDNLVHFFGAATYSTMEKHWQYRGLPPITRIIEGTVYPDAIGFAHWTAGCHGTGGFLRNVLAAVNIPVHLVIVCGHCVVHFLTEDRYLDHGDNPYNLKFKGTGLPASALLIDGATYTAWFGPNPNNHNNNCQNIGHQVDVLSGP
jgi:hypothetical protein